MNGDFYGSDVEVREKKPADPAWFESFLLKTSEFTSTENVSNPGAEYRVWVYDRVGVKEYYERKENAKWSDDLRGIWYDHAGNRSVMVQNKTENSRMVTWRKSDKLGNYKREYGMRDLKQKLNELVREHPLGKPGGMVADTEADLKREGYQLNTKVDADEVRPKKDPESGSRADVPGQFYGHVYILTQNGEEYNYYFKYKFGTWREVKGW